MATIYFVRHGNRQSGGAGDPGLSVLGQRQAQATAECLAAQPVARIVSSPLRRTRETAATLAVPHRLEVHIDPRLRERANWGDLPGQSLAEFVAMWERCNRERDYIPPVGDSSRQAGDRLQTFVIDCHRQFGEQVVVATSHGGAIVDFLLNIFPLSDLARLNPALAESPFSGDIMRECSITVVHFDGSRYALEKVADSTHLPPA